jgi:hypothetical protein
MKLFVAALICLVSAPAVCQKNTNIQRANALKALPQNKKAKVIAYHSTSAYTFIPTADQLAVTQQDNVDLISLQGNLNYAMNVFYNDHVKVENYDLKYASGKSIKKESVCGNYEVESIFYSDAKVCSYRFNFLYEGTEISFSSKSKIDDPRYLTKVFFQDEEPCDLREISFTIPNTVNVEIVEKNFTGFNIEKKVEQVGGNTVYKYVCKQLPALQAEDNSLGALYHNPHLIVLTKDYQTASGKKTVISSVDDLYKWYASLVKEVNNDPAPFKEQVQKLVEGKKTPEEKIKAIYYWVQDNIKYIAFEDGIAGFKPEPAQNVYNNRFGDCKGMANLTKEMLKVAGFDARLTWIGTNRIPYTYDLPSLCVDNHMICVVNVGDKQYILDSTEKYVALGKNAERIQGKEMLVENGEQFIRKKVPVSDPNANIVSRKETLSIDGDIIKGQGELVLNGEAKKNILYVSTNVKQEDQKKVFDNLAVSEYANSDKVEVTSTPSEDRDKPMEMKYSLSLANKISKFDRDLYVDLDWNKNFQNLIIEDDRFSDYYFNRKVKLKTSKKLKLPQGYKVTHLPKGMSKKNSDFSFEMSFKQIGTDLVYDNEITVFHGIVPKQLFSTWNEWIKELKENYNDKVVLTKSK